MWPHYPLIYDMVDQVIGVLLWSILEITGPWAHLFFKDIAITIPNSNLKSKSNSLDIDCVYLAHESNHAYDARLEASQNQITLTTLAQKREKKITLTTHALRARKKNLARSHAYKRASVRASSQACVFPSVVTTLLISSMSNFRLV